MDGGSVTMSEMDERIDTSTEGGRSVDAETEVGDGADSSPAVEIRPERVLEAILFSADSPLAGAKLASILGVGDAKDVRRHIEELNEQYASLSLSFRIEEIAGGYQMLTLPAYNHWLAKLLRSRQESKLSSAALETLAIVAYKQPCTRADVEAVRGVAVGDMLNRLREMNLVKIVGRAEDLGRPMLYGTTKKFLEVFGLPSLEELPQVEALGGGVKAAASHTSQRQAAVAEAVQDVEPPAEPSDTSPRLAIAPESVDLSDPS
ncbi:MAG TPA: SMC-Scp complex subunit ScpB [Phycisphaerae bacterium]|nr:SMC-Scp complex subunit ScpB [Phycisphaerae bacterium]